MLEPLVSSRIRRTLLEHLLGHPDDRFYLRGLAKELGLTISPLRRELKRLEDLGVLSAYQEANIRFYVVNQQTPFFQQLKHAVGQGEPAAIEVAEPSPSAPMTSAGSSARVELPVASMVLSSGQLERMGRVIAKASGWQQIVGLGAAALTIAVLIGLSIYLAMANRQLHSVASPVVIAPHRRSTIVAPRMAPAMAHETSPEAPEQVPMSIPSDRPSAESGTSAPAAATNGAAHQMRSARWRMQPGTIGGFAPAIRREAY